MIFHELGLVAGMPAEASQRPSGVAFSLPRILIVCSGYHCPYEKHCNENESNAVSFTIALEGFCRRYW